MEFFGLDESSFFYWPVHGFSRPWTEANMTKTELAIEKPIRQQPVADPKCDFFLEHFLPRRKDLSRSRIKILNISI